MWILLHICWLSWKVICYLLFYTSSDWVTCAYSLWSLNSSSLLMKAHIRHDSSPLIGIHSNVLHGVGQKSRCRVAKPALPQVSSVTWCLAWRGTRQLGNFALCFICEFYIKINTATVECRPVISAASVSLVFWAAVALTYVQVMLNGKRMPFTIFTAFLWELSWVFGIVKMRVNNKKLHEVNNKYNARWSFV